MPPRTEMLCASFDPEESWASPPGVSCCCRRATRKDILSFLCCLVVGRNKMQERGNYDWRHGALYFADMIDNDPDGEVMLRTLLDYSEHVVGSRVVRCRHAAPARVVKHCCCGAYVVLPRDDATKRRRRICVSSA